MALGLVLNTLGYRSLALAFIPISLGAAVLFRRKIRPYFALLLSVLLVLFIFVPMHQSFNTEIVFQSREVYSADNFFLNHYNWKNPSFVVVDFWTNTYLSPKQSVYEYTHQYLAAGIKADAIFYSAAFAGSGLANYSSIENLSQGQGVDLLYNNGIWENFYKPKSLKISTIVNLAIVLFSFCL